jgi:hypothetical protein
VISVKIDPPQGNALEAMEHFPELLAAEVFTAMLEAGLLLEREAKAIAPVGVFGAAGYRGSIAAIDPYMDGDTLTGGLGTSCPYAAPVELGTRPHFPPVQPLADWVRAKLGETDPGVARSIAFCIARKIAAKGTEGQHVFKRALEASEVRIQAAFEGAVEKTLAKGAAI